MSKTSAKIIEAIEAFKIEDEKFSSGNKAAGTRARKALMEVKKLSDARRKEIQSEKNDA